MKVIVHHITVMENYHSTECEEENRSEI